MAEERKEGDAAELASGIHRRQMAHFRSGATLPLEARLDALRSLLSALESRENDLLEALRSDLGKPAVEAWLAEFQFLRSDLRLAIRKLPSWAKPRRAGHPFYFLPASSRIGREPFGTALVMAPWNYPLQLALSPAIAAIAGGNCVTIKPSELSPASSGLLADLVAEACDPDHVTVVQGEADLGAALLEQPWNAFFFTGGETVGRKVAAAAARHLAPCVLELGGKCPAIIDSTADLKLAAERIGNGKFLNAGQTCIAPDFVAVPEEHCDEFIDHIDAFMTGACSSLDTDLASLPNRHHYDRVLVMATGDVRAFGSDDAEALRLAPRRVKADWEHPAMKQEVFGPLLPILSYSKRDALIDRLSDMPSPLALYIFSGDREFTDELLRRVRSGSACVNDVMKQAVNHELPFGGVGSSGHGRYRGRAGFEAFTFTRPVMRRPQCKDPFFEPPPYGKLLDRLRRLLR